MASTLSALLRRGGDLLFVSFGVSLLSFLMIRLIPGDAVQLMIGANAEVTQAQIEAMRHTLGLDQPFWWQYLVWIGRLLHGDFGVSLSTGRPVLAEISAAAGVTAELTILGLIVAVTMAVPLGVAMVSLRSPRSSLTLRLLSIIGITVPSFWLATLLLYCASALVPGWAVVGWRDLAADPAGNLRGIALPVLSIALPVVASLARMLRTAMTEALKQDYIRTARAKGLNERAVLLRHALRNALIPFVTQAGIMTGYLFAGSVVVEQVFALPGLGRLMVGAIGDRDYALVQAAILLATLVFVLVNTGVDVLYAAIDPRVRA